MLMFTYLRSIVFLLAAMTTLQVLAQETPVSGSDLSGVPLAGAKVLAFDVVSIKPIEPGGRPTHGWIGMQSYPDGLEFGYQGLRDLIQNAYGPKKFPLADQITGFPDWANSQRYDITAKMSPEDIVEFQKLDKAGRSSGGKRCYRQCWRIDSS